MDYAELDKELKIFINTEEDMTDSEVENAIQGLADKMNITGKMVWDLLDLSETSFYNLAVLKKCLDQKKIVYI